MSEGPDLGLYPNGGPVTDKYVESKNQGLSAEETKKAMEKEIKQIGLDRITHHAEDYDRKLNVIDIGPNSIRDKPAFEKAVAAAVASGKVEKYHGPNTYPKDPSYHLEIRQ